MQRWRGRSKSKRKIRNITPLANGHPPYIRCHLFPSLSPLLPPFHPGPASSPPLSIPSPRIIPRSNRLFFFLFPSCRLTSDRFVISETTQNMPIKCAGASEKCDPPPPLPRGIKSGMLNRWNYEWSRVIGICMLEEDLFKRAGERVPIIDAFSERQRRHDSESCSLAVR